MVLRALGSQVLLKTFPLLVLSLKFCAAVPHPARSISTRLLWHHSHSMSIDTPDEHVLQISLGLTTHGFRIRRHYSYNYPEVCERTHVEAGTGNICVYCLSQSWARMSTHLYTDRQGYSHVHGDPRHGGNDYSLQPHTQSFCLSLAQFPADALNLSTPRRLPQARRHIQRPQHHVTHEPTSGGIRVRRSALRQTCRYLAFVLSTRSL